MQEASNHHNSCQGELQAPMGTKFTLVGPKHQEPSRSRSEPHFECQTEMEETQKDCKRAPRKFASRKRWNLCKTALQKAKGAHAHKTQIFNCFYPIEEPNTSEHKPMIKSKDRMYIVDSGASLHMVEESSLSPQKKQSNVRDRPQKHWD